MPTDQIAFLSSASVLPVDDFGDTDFVSVPGRVAFPLNYFGRWIFGSGF
jgi:hypothetical protein